MTNRKAQSAFSSVGEAQIAAAEGMGELGRELVRLLARLFRH